MNGIPGEEQHAPRPCVPKGGWRRGLPGGSNQRPQVQAFVFEPLRPVGGQTDVSSLLSVPQLPLLSPHQVPLTR